MSLFTRIKLGLAIMALIFFAASMRTGLDWQRFVAMGLLVLAVILRFVERFQRRKESGAP
ncbi:MAG TPA: hypothetical protein PKE51_00190 [Gemmatimonadaceae bacterium]|nr:hypothetical protein [Gemmatimonadaceae bacterium]